MHDLVAHAGRVTWKTVGVTCRAGTVEGADEVLHTYDGELLEPYATHQIKAKLKARATHQGQYVLIHSLEGGKSSLPIGVEVRDTYARVKLGKGNITVVVQNMTPNPIYVPRGTLLAQLTEADLMPKPDVKPETLQKLEEIDQVEGITPSTMTRPERIDKLRDVLRLGSLEEADPEEFRRVMNLFEEYQDIFALEPGEIGCCDLATHKICLLKEEPYKERYRPINPRMKEEVRDHIKQMLEAGAIRPSKSPWSNTVVLV